jgi:hypothetical protein
VAALAVGPIRRLPGFLHRLVRPSFRWAMAEFSWWKRVGNISGPSGPHSLLPEIALLAVARIVLAVTHAKFCE